MPAALKRKGSPGIEVSEEQSKRRFAESISVASPADAHDEVPAPTTTADAALEDPAPEPPSPPASSTATPSTDRAARFAALKARSAASRKSNLSATKTEAARQSTPTAALASLSRKRDTAEHNLLKAEIEAQGDDFERKRAWDWTAEESARWDERVAAKRERAARNTFRDYAQEAEKVYERQIEAGVLGRGKSGGGGREAGTKRVREEYEAEKRRAIERAVANGGLEVVELEGGEMIAVDRDGSFVSSSSSAAAVGVGSGGGVSGGKPSKEAVDRLVADIRKAEETRLKKRRDRGKADEDGGDVTYINEKNKQFNLKLARFYDKYTADIRDSFERGTAI